MSDSTPLAQALAATPGYIDPRPGHYYVSILDGTGRPCLALGPLSTHQGALDRVQMVKTWVNNQRNGLDPWREWSYGTCRIDPADVQGKPYQGKLNDKIEGWRVKPAAPMEDFEAQFARLFPGSAEDLELKEAARSIYVSGLEGEEARQGQAMIERNSAAGKVRSPGQLEQLRQLNENAVDSWTEEEEKEVLAGRYDLALKRHTKAACWAKRSRLLRAKEKG